MVYEYNVMYWMRTYLNTKMSYVGIYTNNRNVNLNK